MKNLLLVLPFLTLSKNISAGKEPAYVLTLEAIEECKGTNLREYVILEHLRIFPNHTFSGYMEVVETIPPTATITFLEYTEKNNTWIASPLSIKNLELCRFIEKDVWFVPVGRLMIKLPERCPIRKGHLRFKSLGIIPMGCFKARLIIMDKEKQLSCMDTVTKIAEYSKRYENICKGI